MIILYTFIEEEKHQHLMDRYLDVFSENIKKDIMAYRRWQDAQLSLLGKVMLLHGLRTYYNIIDAELRKTPNNKPYLKDNPVHFNISHSKDLVACVIAKFPVGIDIEFCDPSINFQDFEFQMTPAECVQICKSEDKIKSFFTYWTAKEAVIKAHGDGIMIPLDSFQICNNTGIVDGEKFFVKDFFIDKNYCSCIASNDINVNNVVPVIEFFRM
ncbi:4'-phosphopantetheinyl transferase family protein [Chryseobacterium pennipullorum]|nr:4'-phosphopantetheinyl transferase superfamily protein [Chryseobacterium pennipullorum]